MKTWLLALTSICLFSSLAHADEKVIFDVNSLPSLENFSLFFENPDSVSARPGIQLSPRGIDGKAGDGNFTAYKFADLATPKWTLKVTLQVPAGVRYSNSGIYLLYSNPQADQKNFTESEKQAFQDALRKGQNRRDMYGAGPFELDFFSHEVQIIAGTDATIPPENHGAVAIYGVDIGDKVGQQIIQSTISFETGHTYEITVVSTPNVIETYAKEAFADSSLETAPKLISLFRNVTRNEDPIRGGSPVALLLQGFYNNGRDIQLPIFKRITLEQ